MLVLMLGEGGGFAKNMLVHMSGEEEDIGSGLGAYLIKSGRMLDEV